MHVYILMRYKMALETLKTNKLPAVSAVIFCFSLFAVAWGS